MEHYVWSKNQLEQAKDLLMWYRVNFLDEELIEKREEQICLYNQGKFEEAGEAFNEFMLLAIKLKLIDDESDLELPEHLVEMFERISERLEE